MLPMVKRAASVKAMQQRFGREQSHGLDPLIAHASNDGVRVSSPTSSLRRSLASKEAAEKEKRRKTVFGKLGVLGADLDRIRSDLEGARKKTKYIRVKVLKAKNLPASDDKKIDSFVKLTIDRQTASTQIKQGDLNPAWNEVVLLTVKIPIIPPTMLVEVFDHDIMGVHQTDKDILIASCEISLANMMEDEKSINKSFTMQTVQRRGRTPSRESVDGVLPVISLDIMFVSNAEAKKYFSKSNEFRLRRAAMVQQVPQGILKEESVERGIRLEKEMHLKEDSTRMVLVGHMGRLRHGSSEVRQLAVQAIARTAGERGQDLPKIGHWDTQVCKCLTERMEKDSVLEVRLDAIDAMGFVSKEGNSEAIRVLCKVLKDPSTEVRLAAVNTLLRVVNSGNELAILSMGECLEDSDHSVRAAACQALPQLSSVFDNRLIQQATDRMGSIHAVVRAVAVKALATVTTKGSPVVIEGLIKAVSDRDAQVKMTAMQELTGQVEKGDSRVIQLMIEQLKDVHPHVRRTAATCLESLLVKGDKLGLKHILSVMDDQGKDQYGHLAVQVAALRALQRVAVQESMDSRQNFSPRTESAMLSAILSKLKSPDWCVRREVALCLRTCSRGNEELALQNVTILLEDPVQEVRNEAVQTVEELAPGHMEWLECSLACLLMSSSSVLRIAAASLLHTLQPARGEGGDDALLAATKQGTMPSHTDIISFLLGIPIQRGDEAAVKGFVFCLDHHSAPVRSMAMDCLKCFTNVGQETVIKDLVWRLQSRGPEQIVSTALALSRIVELNDHRAVAAIMDLLESEHRDVRAVVHRALANILPEGDTRITIASACLHLEPEFHREDERKEALRQLAQLAYASHHTRVQGWSIEDADLQAFWQLIRQPRAVADEAAKLLPRIMKRLADTSVWVRTAAVGAARECGVRGDQEVVAALMDLIDDESFAVRTAVVEALSVIAPLGEHRVILALCKTLNDVSHLVRKASVRALRVLVRVGDREAARALMSWFRGAWEYLTIRGNDTDIKLETARLLIDVLDIRDVQKYKSFFEALSSTNLHKQRNEIANFDDTLAYQNLIEPFMEYQRRVSRQGNNSMEDPSGQYSASQVRAIVMIQQFIGKKMHSQSEQASRKTSWHSKARKAIKSTIVEDDSPARPAFQRNIGYGSSHMEKEDQMAEKILRRSVPLDVRSSAIAAAHERSQDPSQDMKLWDKMRWTERLRLCEEMAMTAWTL